MEYKFEWFYNEFEDAYYAKVNNITLHITQEMMMLIRPINSESKKKVLIKMYHEKLTEIRNNKLSSLGI